MWRGPRDRYYAGPLTWGFGVRRVSMTMLLAAESVGSRIAHNLFKLQVPWEEKVIRGVVVYLFLLVVIRVFGRRELGQLTAFDLVVLLTLSNILQNAMIGNDDSLLGGIIGAVVLLSVNFALGYAVFRSRRLERLVSGEPRVLIKDGKVVAAAVEQERLTQTDLMAAIHNQGLERVEDVRLAISEPNGMISVIPKST
jgi:uncharacterized membrane protein YcaP (DUF421 family)